MGVRTRILLYIFLIKYVTAHNRISDITDEHCARKELCEVAGIFGHVDCINDSCVCINNAKFLESENIKGCYKRNKLGDECEFDLDCLAINGTKCIQTEYKKTCECLPYRKKNGGSCEIIKNRAIGTVCDEADECSESLMCLNNKCDCDSNQFYANNRCYTLKEYNMCRNDTECGKGYFCEKKHEDLVYGFCQLSGQTLYSHSCTTIKECKINGYVDCRRGKCTCVDNSIFNNNGCYKQNDVGEKCEFQKDCKDKTECKLDDDRNIKRCKCPEKHAYYENACINIECLNKKKCLIDKDCKNNEKCESDEICNQKFCQCNQHAVKINNKCMDLKNQPWCEKYTDCMVKNSICDGNVCKCSNGTILLNDTCIELKGQKYGDFCHKECASSDTICIRSDHSSTIGVCGCYDNYVRNTSLCKQRKIPGAAVYGNIDVSEHTSAATIISVEIYCFLHFIIIFFNVYCALVPESG